METREQPTLFEQEEVKTRQINTEDSRLTIQQLNNKLTDLKTSYLNTFDQFSKKEITGDTYLDKLNNIKKETDLVALEYESIQYFVKPKSNIYKNFDDVMYFMNDLRFDIYNYFINKQQRDRSNTKHKTWEIY